MKKIIITSLALFTFLIFSGLGLVVLFSNSFGVNVDNSGLLPQFEFTTLDEKATDQLSSLTDFYSTQNVQSITLVNKSGKDITVNYTGIAYSDVKGSPAFYVDGNGVYLSIKGRNVTLNAVPDTYDHYLSNGNGFASYDNPQVYATVEEAVDAESYDTYYESQQVTEDTIIIKDGESYEIKLPE